MFNACQVLTTLLSYPYSVRLVVNGVVVSTMTENIYFLLTS